jgi:tRNA threonylcarbamoyladenosine biosynthesis protein TsaB
MILALQTDGATTRMWLINPAPASIPAPALEWESGRQLAGELLAKLTNTLTEAGQNLAGLTAIVIFSGPGSFTSLRIGHTVANALADSLSIPVVGAQGKKWLEEGIKQLADTPLSRPALPHYGADANITKPH